MQLFVTLAPGFSSHVWMDSRMSLQKSGLRLVLCAVLAASLVLHASAQSGQPASGHTRVPVLVELFTSEGCSLDQMDERQKEYGARFNLDSIYTPQMVVDGAAQMVGNNVAGVTSAVEKAASMGKKPLAIADAHWEGSNVVFTVHGGAEPGPRLLAALAANVTHSEVSRGENAGRTLHHVAVVRVLKDFGANAAEGKPLRLPGGGLAHDNDASGSVRLVVFMVDRKSGHISAVAEQSMNR
jgi:hypothetical protein